MSRLQPGDRIGPYTVVEPLGRGGMGSVYVARDAAGRELALKVLAAQTSPRGVARLEREAQATARLRHPQIVPVHDFGVDRGRAYVVMQRLQGRSLGAWIEARGPLPAEWVARWGAQLARGLAHAHAQGVLHRDLKPENVVLEGDLGDPGARPVVVDFGLAKLLDQGSDLTQTNHLVGTPYYMPPEQFDARRVTPRSDVYSLGATLYEALTGLAPFADQGSGPSVIAAILSGRSPSLARARPDLHPRLTSVIDRCLHADPLQRPESMDALADLLDATPTTPQPRRWAWALLGAALALTPLPFLLRTPAQPPPPAASTPSVTPTRAPDTWTAEAGGTLEFSGDVEPGAHALSVSVARGVTELGWELVEAPGPVRLELGPLHGVEATAGDWLVVSGASSPALTDTVEARWVVTAPGRVRWRLRAYGRQGSAPLWSREVVQLPNWLKAQLFDWQADLRRLRGIERSRVRAEVLRVCSAREFEDPRLAWVYLLMTSGAPREAIQRLQELRDQAPDWSPTMWRWVWLMTHELALEGEDVGVSVEEAAAGLLEVGRENAGVWRVWSHTERAAGRWASAQAGLERALARAPGDRASAMELTWVEHELGLGARAQARLEALWKGEWVSHELRLATVEFGSPSAQEALVVWWEDSRRRTVYLEQVVPCCLALGDPERAERALQAAVLEDPKDVERVQRLRAVVEAWVAERR